MVTGHEDIDLRQHFFDVGQQLRLHIALAGVDADDVYASGAHGGGQIELGGEADGGDVEGEGAGYW
ncbi:MAG: hypothetical protein HC853_07680 [Anaerolineae bacterium]|nr:hypothetical protein [Anaerolineae bacterium]